jgi:hypothetical protein
MKTASTHSIPSVSRTPGVRGLVFALAICQIASKPAAAEPPQFMIEATVQGKYVEGAPLAWSDQKICLLARDGQVWEFSPDDAANYRKTAAYFSPYSAREMQDRLEAEFGRRMEVTATGHYLVAHPARQAEIWAERFEQMYHEFVHNFGVRGISTKQPELPLVAIVFTRQEDFLQYAFRDGVRLSTDVLGYYSPKTNRVALFDIGAGRTTAADWRQNAATVIHEASHQVAFNAGVHNRFAPTPRWLAEGLGTMFEARGVWDPQDYPRQSDRINRGRLAQFKQYAATRHKPVAIQELIASDRLFEQDIAAAYAESWALTFYLAETQSRAYAEYLKKAADRPAFATYPAAQRLADFIAAFGDDWRMLDARLARFIGDLR